MLPPLCLHTSKHHFLKVVRGLQEEIDPSYLCSSQALNLLAIVAPNLRPFELGVWQSTTSKVFSGSSAKIKGDEDPRWYLQFKILGGKRAIHHAGKVGDSPNYNGRFCF